MKYKKYYISNSEGKSNCVIRTLCKILNTSYDKIYSDLCNLANHLNCSSFNDVEVFETYLRMHGFNAINYGKDTKIKDLVIDNGTYIIFCWDKKDFYHMIPIINNVVYDKDNQCLDLYTITVYKNNNIA